jgi:hypothetical protein
VQNMATGGTSKTSTPMLRLRAKRLFWPIEARHMTHWASVEPADSVPHNTTPISVAAERINDLRPFLIFKIYFFSAAGWAGPGDRSSRARKLSGKKTSSIRQMQRTSAGTIVNTRFKRSNRRCMK